MPIYQYRNLNTGKIEEHFRTIARRDCAAPHLKRITVPQRVGYANHSGLREPGAFTDVPKAFRDYELSGVSPAKIEHETGFSRDEIRRTWNFLFLLCAFLCLPARASDINAGYSWTPTDRVTAAKLNSQITGASINTTFATDKSSAQPVGADTMLFYQSSSGAWRKTSLNVLLLQNTNLIVTQTEDLAPATNDFILTWDVSANTLARVTLGTVITNTARFVATNGLFTYQGPLVGVESSNSVNVAHGLGVTPGFVRCVLVCTNADRNYAVGDEVDAAGVTDNDGVAGLGISVNATSVIVQEGNINLRVFDHVPGHTPQAIIYAKWNIKVYLRP